MAAGEVKPGKFRYIYISTNSGGTALAEIPSGGSTTWTRLGKIQGGSNEKDRDEYEIKEQDNDEVTYALGHKSRKPGVKITCRPGNVLYDLVLAAFEANTPFGVGFADGDKTVAGVTTDQFNCSVKSFKEGRDHGDVSIDMEFRVNASTPYPPTRVVTA